MHSQSKASTSTKAERRAHHKELVIRSRKLERASALDALIEILEEGQYVIGRAIRGHFHKAGLVR
jgi:hypothetical protein